MKKQLKQLAAVAFLVSFVASAQAQAVWKVLVDETFGVQGSTTNAGSGTACGTSGSANVSQAPATELSPGTTTYTAHLTNALTDGSYAVVSTTDSVDDFCSGYDNQWQHGLDHTVGDTNGYMAAFNANPAKGGEANGSYYEFSTATADVPGATYRISYWAANILRFSATPLGNYKTVASGSFNNGFYEGYIKLRVRSGSKGAGTLYGEDPDQTVAYTRPSTCGTTGGACANYPANGTYLVPGFLPRTTTGDNTTIPWQSRGFTFKLGAGYDAAALYFNWYNSSAEEPRGAVTTNGNDIVIDDIKIEMATASISGVVFIDQNENGVRDGTEALFSTPVWVASVSAIGKVVDWALVNPATGGYTVQAVAWSTDDIGQKLVLMNAQPVVGATVSGGAAPVATVPLGWTVVSESPNSSFGNKGSKADDGVEHLTSAPNATHPNFNFGLRRMPSVSVQKVTEKIAGGPFVFTATNLSAALANVTTTAAAIAQPVSPVAVPASVANTAVTISETGPANWSQKSVVCNDSNAALSGNTNPVVPLTGGSGQLTLPALVMREDAVINCVFTNLVPPTPFATCPTEAFVTRDTALYAMNLQTGALSSQGTSPVLQAGGGTVNAIGFGNDGYIWGWFNGSGPDRQLARIGQSGVADLPYAVAPAGLEGVAFYAGDIDPVTGFLVLSSGGALYVVNVTTNTLVAGPISVSLSQSTDIAFDKVGQNPGGVRYLYSVDNASGKVFRRVWNGSSLGSEDVLTTLPLTPGSGGWGAVFLDGNGSLYAYRSGTQGGIETARGMVYRVFRTSAGTWAYDQLTDNADSSINLDGARCPAAASQVPPALLLRKTTVDGTGGAFNFTLTNATDGSAAVTTTAANLATAVDGDAAIAGQQAFSVISSGQNVTITEASAAALGWVLRSASCRSIAGTEVGTLSGNTYTIPAAAVVNGAVFECDFVNEKNVADLYITKTNGAASVVAGVAYAYTIEIGNKGPHAADGAVLRDPAVSGMSCVNPVQCAATNTSCPAVDVAALQAGLVIPTFPKDSRLIFTLTCTNN